MKKRNTLNNQKQPSGLALTHSLATATQIQHLKKKTQRKKVTKINLHKKQRRKRRTVNQTLLLNFKIEICNAITTIVMSAWICWQCFSLLLPSSTSSFKSFSRFVGLCHTLSFCAEQCTFIYATVHAFITHRDKIYRASYRILIKLFYCFFFSFATFNIRYEW